MNVALMAFGIVLIVGAFTGTGVMLALPVTFVLLCSLIARNYRQQRATHGRS